MNKPDDVSAEAWEMARDIEFDFDCDWTADGRRSGEFERQFATVLIARAIDAAIAKERERVDKTGADRDRLVEALRQIAWKVEGVPMNSLDDDLRIDLPMTAGEIRSMLKALEGL